MQLTKDQQKGADAFFNFLMSDERTFVLSGGAGVGKTFLMKYLKDHMAKRYVEACSLLGLPVKYKTTVFTATTNKAAEVLSQTIQEPVKTIHSFLALKVTENYRTGKTDIEKTNRWKEHRDLIVFIDESSMIDSTLYNEILQALPECKLIFVGDHAQMAPVKEALSPIYTSVDPNNFIFLSEPIRNADSPALMALCDQLRNTVETEEFNPILEVPGTVEYLSNDMMQKKLIETFKTETDDARVLCYTNKRVQAYNDYIREIRGKNHLYDVGDVLVVAQAYASGATNLSVEKQVCVHSVDHDLLRYKMDGVNQIHYYKATISPLDDSRKIEVNIAENPLELEDVIKQLAKQKRWQDYFIMKNTFIDLRGKEACTVYKSQGSTYHTVFMDLGNIGTSFNAKQVARMLFVGASRATTKLYLFGKLPPRYYQSRKPKHVTAKV